MRVHHGASVGVEHCPFEFGYDAGKKVQAGVASLPAPRTATA